MTTITTTFINDRRKKREQTINIDKKEKSQANKIRERERVQPTGTLEYRDRDKKRFAFCAKDRLKPTTRAHIVI